MRYRRLSALLITVLGLIAGLLCSMPYLLALKISPVSDMVDASPFLIIGIHSAVGDYARRSLLRRTWANTADRIGTDATLVRFLVGGSGVSGEERRLLDAETLAHGDLEEGDFVDAYRNMTRKNFFGLQWAARHFGAAFFLKTDSDVFVDVRALVDRLRQLDTEGASRGVYCYTPGIERPERSEAFKWSVSKEAFAGDFYPKYCRGPAYVMHTDVVRPLMRAVRRRCGVENVVSGTHGVQCMQTDDVLITGVARDTIAARLVQWNAHYQVDPMQDECFTPSIGGQIRPWFDVGPHPDAPDWSIVECWARKRPLFMFLQGRAKSLLEPLWHVLRKTYDA